MYTLVRTLVRPNGHITRYRLIDISAMPLITYYQTYRDGIAILSNPAINHEVSLDLNVLRPELAGSSMTLPEYLVSIGNKSLPTSNMLPQITPEYAEYADIFHAGYRVQLAAPGHALDTNLSDADKTWLHLSRQRTDYTLFHESCLVSVNGFFHLTDRDATGVYVVDGMTSCRISGNNQMGMYSFRKLGKLRFIPIKPEMIYQQNPNIPLTQSAFIDAGEDLSAYTVFAVIGGFLHARDPETFYPVGDNVFCMNFSNLQLLPRLQDSIMHIDLSSLPFIHNPRNPSQMLVEQVYTDEVIRAYMSLSQSFLVVLDNPEVFVDTHALRMTPNSGMYTSYLTPRYPLQHQLGKMIEYWPVYEDTQWAITCQDSLMPRYMMDTIDPRKAMSVDGSLTPVGNYHQATPQFLMIGHELTWIEAPEPVIP